MSTTSAPVVPTSMVATGRSLAPDLARGTMLLLIVLANTPWYLYGSVSGLVGTHPVEGTALDKVVQVIITTAVDLRIYPMFAFLFGYGIVQLHRSQRSKGVDEPTIRRILRRRHLWMIAIGAVHAALLWYGDIIGAYGLVGLVVVAAFLHRRDATLKAWAIVLGCLVGSSALFMIVIGILLAVALPLTGAGTADLTGGLDMFGVIKSINGEPNWLAGLPLRLGFWAVLVPGQGFLSLVVPTAVLIAFWAARHQVLERPGEHRRLLVRAAVIGIGVSWLCGAVQGLTHVGVLPLPTGAELAFLGLQPFSGMLGGVGYVALFGLISDRLGRRGTTGSPVVTALAAVGKRSMTCYLAQSVLVAPLLAGWGLGWGAWLGSAATAGIAIAVWLITVAFAVVLERAGRRGPAETLLRRLSYPRPTPAAGSALDRDQQPVADRQQRGDQ